MFPDARSCTFWLIPAFICITVLFAVPAHAQLPEPPANTSRCGALAAEDFSDIEDAPTQILDAIEIGARDHLPAHCRVRGYVSPQVGFELLLPSADWNSKFMEVGCGGFCGDFEFAGLCDEPLRRGYACGLTDMGHRSSILDGKWAFENLQAQVDYGIRATHVMAVAGKAVAERYYGRPATRAYFLGCSCGGRQGLVEAQRFPWDFDGIVVGAPGISPDIGFVTGLWRVKVLTGKNGKPLLERRDVDLLHRAVVSACDLKDGVRDGLIGDPRYCRFDPMTLLCKSGQRRKCLSREQVDAVKRFYAGPSTSNGEKLGFTTPLGAEVSYMGILGFETAYRQFAREFFDYMGFTPAPGPKWDPATFDFDRDYKRMGVISAISGGDDPDLRRFEARGGKLILWQGWADGAALRTIDYFETVERTMGGAKATRKFFRLFMVPGMDHCWGGEGAATIDYLSYLEAWVEKKQAPDVLMSAHVKEDGAASIFGTFPLDPRTVSFTRPVYAYPLRAQYKGHGDPNDAANFEPVGP